MTEQWTDKDLLKLIKKTMAMNGVQSDELDSFYEKIEVALGI